MAISLGTCVTSRGHPPAQCGGIARSLRLDQLLPLSWLTSFSEVLVPRARTWNQSTAAALSPGIPSCHRGAPAFCPASPIRCVDRAQVRGPQQASVLRPQFQRLDRLAAFPIHQKQVQLALLEQKVFSPLPQRDEDKVESAAFVRQRVLLVGAAARRRDGLKDPVRYEFLQPGAQDVLRQPEALMKLAEPPLAEESIAHDQ